MSFVETGRSRPSAEMVLHLAEQLDVPLRDRHALLSIKSFFPADPETARTMSSLVEAGRR